MKIESTFIPNLKLIHLDMFLDNRGSFLKVFNSDIHEECGLVNHFRESYFSISHKNVIRGMHFQVPPQEHYKLVCLVQGKILDVVLDIRKSSPSFGQFYSIELNTSNPILVYIPVGCAHGFLSLQSNTIIAYLQTTVYSAACDKGIKFDSFGMNWGIVNPIVSKRDNEFPTFNHFKTPFLG